MVKRKDFSATLQQLTDCLERMLCITDLVIYQHTGSKLLGDTKTTYGHLLH